MQTITSIAVLGTRYSAGIQYRVFDNANALYPGFLGDNLANGTHLGNGVWKAVAILPDAGGEVRWYADSGARILAVDVTGPTLAPQQTEILQLCEAFVEGRVDVDYVTATMTQYNKSGTIRRVFHLRNANDLPATNGSEAVKRIPVV